MCCVRKEKSEVREESALPDGSYVGGGDFF